MWPFGSLDPARRCGLAADGPLSAWNEEPFNRLRSHYPQSVSAQTLSQGWSVHGRDDVLRTIDWLFNEGHAAEARQVVDALGRGIRYLPACDHPDGRIEFSRENLAELRSKGLLAWDLGRIASVARWSYTANYVSADEAWEWILLASTRIQSCYQSWEEFGQGWLLGFGYWLDGGEINDRFQSSLDWLNRSVRSPWKRIKWDTLLESKTQTEAVSVDIANLRKQP